MPMGSRGRKRARSAATLAVPAPPPLHITVTVVGKMDSLNFDHETALVKAALLYADRVTLVSPKAYLFADLAAFASADRRVRLDGMAQLTSMFDPRIGETYQRLRSQVRLSPTDRKNLAG